MQTIDENELDKTVERWRARYHPDMPRREIYILINEVLSADAQPVLKAKDVSSDMIAGFEKAQGTRSTTVMAESIAKHAARPVTQDWVNKLPLMQQSVLLCAIRGADGIPKGHPSKMLVRYYRRCILLSAFDRRPMKDAFEPGGGAFTGPMSFTAHELQQLSVESARLCAMSRMADEYFKCCDDLPAHYQVHIQHAAEIVGYKHPEASVREFWFDLYRRIVSAMHCWIESPQQMNDRLSDDKRNWNERNDITDRI